MNLVEFDPNQKAVLQGFQDAKNYPAAYDYMRNIVNEKLLLASDEATKRDLIIASNWLKAAKSINSNDGSFSNEMVRGSMYVAVDLTGRNLTDAEFQKASDQLAVAVLDSVLITGAISSIDQIIDQDVSSAVNGLGLEKWNWAGTLGDILPVALGGLGYDFVQVTGETNAELVHNYGIALLQNAGGLARSLYHGIEETGEVVVIVAKTVDWQKLILMPFLGLAPVGTPLQPDTAAAIRDIGVNADGNLKLTVPLASSAVGEATLLYKKDSVQISVAGISLMEVPKDSTITVGKQNVSVSHSYGDLSATYRLTAQGVAVAWRNADGGLAVEQTYGFDGLPVNTTWKQNGQTFTGPAQDLAAFISQTSTQASALVLSQTLASQQAQMGALLATPAEGAFAAAENALSLKALQHRLAQEPYSDRWSPTALGASIPFALRLSNGLQAAIQQVLNIAQQGWGTYNVGVVTILPLEVSGSGQYHLPLVLDLAGNGIKMLPPSQSNAMFDHNADGVKSAVGWVGADNGILVFDTNGNGAIDNATEWFGESFSVPGSKAPAGQNGFSALATLAASGSAVFSRDTALINPSTGGSYFDAVKVWVDADQNGISTPDELKTLTSLGIASIDLISTHDGRQVGGGLIDSTAVFTFTNGTRRDIADIGLAEKTEAAQGGAPINPGTLIFADYASKGYASMAAGQARGADAALATTAPDFVGYTAALQAWSVKQRYRSSQGFPNPLLGVRDRTLITFYEGESGAEQGSTAGKEVMALLQQGSTYYGSVRATLQAVDAGAIALEQAQIAAQIGNAVPSAEARSTAQAKAHSAAISWGAAAASYLTTSEAWAAYTGRLEALRGQVNSLVPVNKNSIGHLPGNNTFFSPDDAGFAADTFTAYAALLQLSRDLKVGIDTSLGAFAQSAGYAKAYTGVAGGTVAVDKGYNLILAGSGAQRFVLNNSVDNVLVSQASGQVTLQGFQAGSAGDQIQLLGLGDSASLIRTQEGLRVIAADGQRYVDLLATNASDLNLFANFSGLRALSFVGYDQAGVRSLRNNGLNDGQVHINEIIASNHGDTLIGGDWSSVLRGGIGNDTFLVTGRGAWIDGGAGTDVVSYTEIAGGVNVNLSSGRDSLESTLFNIDNITGSAWSDTLTGTTANNVLAGGRGNDRLEGSGGNDVYVFDRGDGQDKVINGVSGNTGPSSILKLQAGIKAADLWLGREGNNLVVVVLGSHDRVEIQDWFAADYRKLAAIELSNGLRLGSDAVELAIATQQSWKQVNPGFNPVDPLTINKPPSLDAYFTAQVDVPLVPSISNVALETRRVYESGAVTQGAGLATTAANQAATAIAALDGKSAQVSSLGGQVSLIYVGGGQNTYRYYDKQDPQAYILTTMKNWDTLDVYTGRPKEVESFQRITALNPDALYVKYIFEVSYPMSSDTSNSYLERGVGAVSTSLAAFGSISSALSITTTVGHAVTSSAQARQYALGQAVNANDSKSSSTVQSAKDAANAFESGLGSTVSLYQDALGALSNASALINQNAANLNSILPPTVITTTQRYVPPGFFPPYSPATWVTVTNTRRYEWATTVDRDKANALLAAQASAQDAYTNANASLQVYKAALGSGLGYANVEFVSGAQASAVASAVGSLLISGAGSGHSMVGGTGRDTFLFTELVGANSHLVNGFQVGVGGDQLLLTSTSKTVYLDEDGSTQVRLSFSPGTPLLTLTGVNLNALSLYDNLLGVATVDYSGSSKGIVAQLDSLTPRDFDGFTHVQNLNGSALADRLSGDSQDNIFNGGAGDDVLIGKGGNNVLNGGTGIDTASYEGAPAGVVVDLAKGTASNGYGGVDRLTSIENVLGSSHDDILSGDAGSNRLEGEAGNDLLIGGGGYDYYMIARGQGHDTLINGIGEARGALYIDNESRESLWFQRAGNDLRVQLLGSDTDITVQGWYDNSVSRLDRIALGGSHTDYLLGTQVDQLVQAMAGFSGSHPGFDPKASGVISDASLLATLSSSWLTSPAA
ncbi:calcium-binding protein [Pseudomonas rhodesiae]|uniref:calcium-binding protein n=1 Tax=Pseudomonas rhodesiae TaxID=76760 RepID=UPI00058BCA60|nr:calcium-binding protein [Pseudomonas rhodesiae]